jgi:hypothetical protein
MSLLAPIAARGPRSVKGDAPAQAILALTILAGLLAACPARAQVEKILDTPAGWTYRTGVTSATITSDINAGLRPFSIHRVSSTTYDVVTVQNSGDYAVSGFGTGNMHYNRTITQLGNDLANRRLVSLDCYEVSGITQATAISVPNTGGAAAGWGWLVGQTRQQIVDWVANSSPSLRILDLSIYTVGGQRYYAAVAVNNTGSQNQGWWWYFDKTPQEIADLLTQNGARLVDIELETAPTLFTAARFACVMVAQNPGAGWYYGALTEAQLGEVIGQTGGRLTGLHRYTNSLGSTRFAVSLVDNANAQTRRVRDLMAAQATSGSYGFRLKRVGGDVPASLHENFVFEPASTMKILHGAYAIRECALGNRTLGGLINVPNRCTDEYNNNVCPEEDYNCLPGQESMSTTIQRMLQNSHNGRTRTLEELFTRTTLNSFADNTAGLGNTQINHTLGCLCGNTPNTTTAADMVRFYEQIADGSFFNSTWEGELYDLMANTTAWGYGTSPGTAFYTLRQVIDQEAAQTNLTSTEIANFRAALRYAVKGGAYGCGDTRWRSAAGWVSIPFKVNFMGSWLELPREYAFATFVDGGTDPGATIAYAASEEILREQIAEALQTWDNACAVGVAGHPASVTVNEGADATFTVTPLGAGAATFRWQGLFNGQWQNLSDFAGGIAGATTATLTVVTATEADERQYRCRITKDCGVVFSNPATLTVQPGYISSAPGALPERLVLHAPRPNPFNPQVTLSFELPRAVASAVLEIFDVAGRRVRVISASSLPAGASEFTWDGVDDSGKRQSSGMYLARLSAGGEQSTQRLMMVE